MSSSEKQNSALSRQSQIDKEIALLDLGNNGDIAEARECKKILEECVLYDSLLQDMEIEVLTLKYKISTTIFKFAVTRMAIAKM